MFCIFWSKREREKDKKGERVVDFAVCLTELTQFHLFLTCSENVIDIVRLFQDLRIIAKILEI